MNKHPKYDHLEIYKFKSGQSGNLLGRPKASQTILRELGFSKPMIAVMIAEIAFMPFGELEKLVELPHTYNSEECTEPTIRLAIATAFKKAALKGEYSYIEPYLKILFGRPVPLIQLNDDNSNHNRQNTQQGE